MTQSRRLVLVALALAAGGAQSGCSLVGFEITQPIPAQTVPGNPLGSLLPASLFQIPIDVDVGAATQAMGTGPASSVTLKAFTLTVMSPAGGTFEFMDSISINISSPNDSRLPTMKIADLPVVPAETTISIPPTGDVNLLPYINAGAEITATASGHVPPQDVTFTGQFKLKVSA